MMDRYIGTKIVLAEPMDGMTFTMTVRASPDVVTMWPDSPSAPGYLVVYEDGYRSWSPREVFERAYRRVTDAERGLIERGAP